MYEIFNNSNVVELITTDPAWTHGRREGKEREWLQTASQSSSIRTPALNQLLQKSLSFCQVQQKCRKTCLEKKNSPCVSCVGSEESHSIQISYMLQLMCVHVWSCTLSHPQPLAIFPRGQRYVVSTVCHPTSSHLSWHLCNKGNRTVRFSWDFSISLN